MRPELLIVGAANACAYCGAAIDAGVQAWWIEDEQVFACTTCVPAGEGAAHSVSHVVTRKREPRQGWR